MMLVQREVEGSSCRTSIPSRPLFQAVTPKTPQFRRVRGDFEPMVTDEEEIVGTPPHSVIVWGVSIRDDVPTKEGPEDFRGYARGYV